MTSFTFGRESFVPNSVPVTDPLSDAVIYIGKTAAGEPRAAAFFGKQTKPVWNYRFRTAEALELEVKRTLESRRATLAMKTKLAAERKAEGNPWAEGAIAYVSWGYEQTNCSAYQCIEVRGMVAIFRKIGMESTRETSSMSGYSKPVADSFIGEPIRVMAKGGGKIDGHRLNAWDGKRDLYWSSYA